MDDFMIENEIVKNECREFEKIEDNLHKELDSDRFFHLLEHEYGYDFKTISKYIEGGIYSFNEQHDFNIVLRKLKREHGISIAESIIFLEETIMMNQILRFIDDETEWILRDEMEENYSISKKKNNIFSIMS